MYEGNVLGRSAWAAISMTRAARLEELDELKRTERVDARVMGARRKRRANILVVVCNVWVGLIYGRKSTTKEIISMWWRACGVIAFVN
jgi:hypothetical protein